MVRNLAESTRRRPRLMARLVWLLLGRPPQSRLLRSHSEPVSFPYSHAVRQQRPGTGDPDAGKPIVLLLNSSVRGVSSAVFLGIPRTRIIPVLVRCAGFGKQWVNPLQEVGGGTAKIVLSLHHDEFEASSSSSFDVPSAKLLRDVNLTDSGGRPIADRPGGRCHPRHAPGACS